MSALAIIFVLVVATLSPSLAVFFVLLAVGESGAAFLAIVAWMIYTGSADAKVRILRRVFSVPSPKATEKVKIVERHIMVGVPLTKDEAFSALGLAGKVSRRDVEQAYRNMMKRVHPDQGGSQYLAAKVNEAKQLLLGKG